MHFGRFTAMPTLMDRFFQEESPEVVWSIVDARLRAAADNLEFELLEFNFNVFDVVIRLKEGVVTLYDVLDPQAEQSVPLAEFIGRASA